MDDYDLSISMGDRSDHWCGLQQPIVEPCPEDTSSDHGNEPKSSGTRRGKWSASLSGGNDPAVTGDAFEEVDNFTVS